ncbi:unnamed protein product [Durusdinium trenchii]|uniref:Uncharacterized protein n=1 Tax=Durusdinium trenchii TaxID=1381693 RepID=A0ABP0K2R8_9DINO
MPQFQCDLPFSIGTGRSRHRLQKHYLTAGNCGTGSLLGQAERQFQQLAEALNRSYGELSWWGEEATRLYSCDNERNLGSLDLLSSFLFPRSLQATVNTMPPKEDPFQLPGRIATSPCDGSVLPTLKEIRAERPFRDFAARWKSQANVTWNHMLYDCVLSARCAGVRLPESISEELADEALAWGFRQQLAAVFHSNWTTWAASKAHHDLHAPCASSLGSDLAGLCHCSGSGALCQRIGALRANGPRRKALGPLKLRSQGTVPMA